eukprot:TRINITY_DN7118_c0_g1_i1.p1 TRINITY_DN7118_c0_g1~~TRINITY_DN7118_c0_g1_i1.p1  ORF type:complete len:137 (-),score=37.57 TRINITY_DN7118_c0_g1_i1:170-541(-)
MATTSTQQLASRLQVLSSYKALLRTRRLFRDDPKLCNAITQKARQEFNKHRNESDPAKIKELLKEAADAEAILRKHVQQIEIVSKDKVRLIVRPELTRKDVVGDLPDFISGGGCGGAKARANK